MGKKRLTQKPAKSGRKTRAKTGQKNGSTPKVVEEIDYLSFAEKEREAKSARDGAS